MDLHNVKPGFACEICGKAFEKLSKRTRHRKSVHGLKPGEVKMESNIKCCGPGCTLTFPSFASYRMHLKNDHGMQDAEEKDDPVFKGVEGSLPDKMKDVKEGVKRNMGCDIDYRWINRVAVNTPAVNSRIKYLQTHRSLANEHRIAWLMRAVTCLDLTTLAGDDTPHSVARLCQKAANPIHKDILNALGMQNIDVKVAAVCVYPARVQDCVQAIKRLGASIPVASVATGFPAGQYPLKTRLLEVEYAVTEGAQEVDIVINRTAALEGDWTAVYNEVKHMRKMCGSAHLKAILATGELGSLTNVYKASLVSMMAGADFIKTSTGKEPVNATLPVGLTMARAIRDYERQTGYKVGFKPAGGIRTCQDALNWQILMKEELGDDWLKPDLFRIGASGLLGDIEKELYRFVFGYAPLEWQLISA